MFRSTLFIIFGLTGILLTTAQSPCADGTFPFTAKIMNDHAVVRSGPGENFYTTAALRQGDEIEVYRLHNQNWYAIRPLDKSFSWVPTQSLKLTDTKGVVQVIQSGVRTYVGSHLEATRNVKYTRLRKRERLLLFNENDEMDKQWVRIRPPSGEFRFVHIDEVQGEAALDTNVASLPNKSEEISKATVSNINLATYETHVDEKRTPGKGRMTTEPIPSLDASQVKESQPDDSSDHGWVRMEDEIDAKITSFSHNSKVNNRRMTLEQTKPTSKSNDLAAEGRMEIDIKKALAQINMDLSRIVSNEPPTWDFTSIRARTEAIVDQASSAHQRQSGRDLLRRISDFQQLQLRFDRLRPNGERDFTDGSRADSQRSRTPFRFANYQTRQRPTQILSQHRATGVSNDSIYEGQGWLMPVYTDRTDIPNYSLTDRNGAILAFVSPRSGLNLRPYLRRQVGIIGEQVYHKELKKPHLSASRIVVLDRQKIWD